MRDITLPPYPDFDPFEMPLAGLGHALRSGRTSAQALIDAFLARIEAFDGNGPAINAISMLNPSARDEARRLDDELRTHGPRGPLHGMPMVVKDNIDAAGMPTTAGCAALKTAVPLADAACVARLRAAGAIVLAKTNMSELAASHGRFGYSSASGLTLNPYRLSRNASGSSSGSGAAVAASLAAFGLGTDSFGSVRGPACVHALVGLRPTHGLVDNAGVLPLSPSFDTVGPLARCVSDVEVVMDALAPGRGFGLAPATLAGRRLAVVSDFAGGNQEIDTLFGRALATIQAAGAACYPVRLPAAFMNLYADLLGEITRAQWAAALDSYLGRFAGSAPATAQALLAKIEAGMDNRARQTNPLTVDALRQSIEARNTGVTVDMAALRRVRALIDQTFHACGADAMIFPTQACPASPRFDQADASYHCQAAQPLAAMHVASATGLPEVSMPMGFTKAGVPAGLSWLGRGGTDAALLSMASAFETLTQHRRAPDCTPSLQAGRLVMRCGTI